MYSSLFKHNALTNFKISQNTNFRHHNCRSTQFPSPKFDHPNTVVDPPRTATQTYVFHSHERSVESVGHSETEEKYQALGLGRRAMTEVDSPRFAVGLGRRFASCDLYPVYSCRPSSLPPGIPRDVCGYLTRENNLRKYIALTCPTDADKHCHHAGVLKFVPKLGLLRNGRSFNFPLKYILDILSSALLIRLV